MDVKKRVIYETVCEFAVYGDTYTRFFADGDFHTVPNNVEGAAKENGPRVVAEYEVAVYGGAYARFLVNDDPRRQSLRGSLLGRSGSVPGSQSPCRVRVR